MYPVKLLGALGMVDDGEADWKVIAIALDDPLSSSINTMDDVHKHMPNKVKSIVDWFKFYKVNYINNFV